MAQGAAGGKEVLCEEVIAGMIGSQPSERE
jgi:hypothetical protein